MGQEPDDVVGESNAFARAADWFQQMAAPFAQVRGLDDLLRPRAPLETLFEAVRAGMIGRRVETGAVDGRLAFTLSALDARFDTMGAAAGQADDVSVVAHDVEYAGVEFTRVAAALGNVHTRIGTKPALVCAPVDLTVTLGPAQCETVLRQYASQVTAYVTDGSRARVSLRKHPRWGWVEVDVATVSGRVTLRPVAFGWRKRGRRIRRRLPAISLPLKLPASVQVVDVSVDPDAVTVSLRINEWRVDYGRLLGLARKPR